MVVDFLILEDLFLCVNMVDQREIYWTDIESTFKYDEIHILRTGDFVYGGYTSTEFEITLYFTR